MHRGGYHQAAQSAAPDDQTEANSATRPSSNSTVKNSGNVDTNDSAFIDVLLDMYLEYIDNKTPPKGPPSSELPDKQSFGTTNTLVQLGHRSSTAVSCQVPCSTIHQRTSHSADLTSMPGTHTQMRTYSAPDTYGRPHNNDSESEESSLFHLKKIVESIKVPNSMTGKSSIANQQLQAKQLQLQWAQKPKPQWAQQLQQLQQHWARQPQTLQPQTLQPQQQWAQQPQTLQPQTLHPQTLQPQTLQPQTLQPQTLQPQTLQPQQQWAQQPQHPQLQHRMLLSSSYQQQQQQQQLLHQEPPPPRHQDRQYAQPQPTPNYCYTPLQKPKPAPGHRLRTGLFLPAGNPPSYPGEAQQCNYPQDHGPQQQSRKRKLQTQPNEQLKNQKLSKEQDQPQQLQLQQHKKPPPPSYQQHQQLYHVQPTMDHPIRHHEALPQQQRHFPRTVQQEIWPQGWFSIKKDQFNANQQQPTPPSS
ncbi:activating signal cointegrator 1 complex subunit 2 homolog [Cloeon dipterum]|uniref:activating signal cointegrator 1 complex subunit 2 homolog n=1 Tax=Cloeon dipterum TaxID=197152 RepID=UPI00322017E6